MKHSILPCLRDVATRARIHTSLPAIAGVRSPMSAHSRWVSTSDWMKSSPHSWDSYVRSVTVGTSSAGPDAPAASETSTGALPALAAAAASRSLRAASFLASFSAFSAALRFLSASRFAASSSLDSCCDSESAMAP